MKKPFAITLDPGSSLANHTGSWRTDRPVYVDRLPPCNNACPAGEDIQGWLVETDGSLTVALDTALTDELIDEGLAREFVNRVQNLRKDSGFEVIDRIRIRHNSSERLIKALNRMTEYVKQETLALELQAISSEDAQKLSIKSEDINGEKSLIAVVRI